MISPLFQVFYTNFRNSFQAKPHPLSTVTMSLWTWCPRDTQRKRFSILLMCRSTGDTLSIRWQGILNGIPLSWSQLLKLMSLWESVIRLRRRELNTLILKRLFLASLEMILCIILSSMIGYRSNIMWSLSLSPHILIGWTGYISSFSTNILMKKQNSHSRITLESRERV